MPHTEIIHHYKRKDFRIALLFLTIFFALQIIGLLTPATFQPLLNLIPISLLVVTGVLHGFHKEWDLNYLFASIVVVVLIFLISALNIENQKIFGPLFYGNSLGWKIWETPFIVGIFWFIIIYCIYGTLEFFRMSDSLKSFLGGVMVVSFDIFIEPVAGRLEMWQWLNDEVLSQNYLAWFVLSYIIFRGLHFFKVNIHNPLAMPLLILLFITFFILSFTL